MRFRDVMCVMANHIRDELDRWGVYELVMFGITMIGAGVTVLLLIGR